MEELSRKEWLALRNDSDPNIRAELPDPVPHAEFGFARRERIGDWVRRYVDENADPPGFEVPDYEDPNSILSDHQLEYMAHQVAAAEDPARGGLGESTSPESSTPSSPAEPLGALQQSPVEPPQGQGRSDPPPPPPGG